VAATRGSRITPSTDTLPGLTSEIALMGRDTEARATLAKYLALESTRTRTIGQWDLPDDNAAFLRFHLGSKAG
jgi:hypothetical protein